MRVSGDLNNRGVRIPIGGQEYIFKKDAKLMFYVVLQRKCMILEYSKTQVSGKLNIRGVAISIGG